jgi:hypothetical protein
MTVEQIKQAHLAYWRHTEACWTTANPANGITGCGEHDELYAVWQGKLNACPGVYVNEASIRATGRGLLWWAEFVKYRDHWIKTLNTSEYFVMCDSEQDARALVPEMTGHGVPPGAIKIKTFGQCQHLRSRT